MKYSELACLKDWLWKGASCIAVWAMVGCATEPSALTGEKTAFGYTWQQELQLGKQTDGQIVQEMGLYADDELASYVRGVGEKVLAQSDLRGEEAIEMYRNTDFTFRVLDSEVVNAFALPGGFVYVTRGLLAHLDNEAQLAVVLGHEITHVAGRHASKQALKQQWGQIGLMAGAVLGDQLMENKQLAGDLLNAGGQVFQLMTLKYGRDAERESDLFGVEYAQKAGYDAAEGAEFFVSLSRISEKSGQSIPTWMSSHPDPGEREVTIRKLAKEWSASHPGDEKANERYMRMIEGLSIGENPRNGFARGGTFYHPELRFQFDAPQGWQVRNQPSAVYVVDPSGKGILLFRLASEKSASEAAQKFATDNGINVVGTSRIESREGDGLVLEGTLQSGTDVMMIQASFIEFGDRVVNFIGYTMQGLYPSFNGAFARAAGSFDSLDDRNILNIQPTRIELARAAGGKPFRDYLGDSLPGGTDKEDWAIMNQTHLDEVVPAGRILKLPR